MLLVADRTDVGLWLDDRRRLRGVVTHTSRRSWRQLVATAPMDSRCLMWRVPFRPYC